MRWHLALRLGPRLTAQGLGPRAARLVPITLYNIENDQVQKPPRVRKQPLYLQDCYCKLDISSSPLDSQFSYPIQIIFSMILSSSHKAFTAAISSKNCYIFSYWRYSKQSEIFALKANNTWTITNLPRRKHVIGRKWVYKVKFKANNTIERYKARSIAKGYIQQEGQIFMSIFLQLLIQNKVRWLLAVAAVQDWHLFQLDVNKSILYGGFDEEV